MKRAFDLLVAILVLPLLGILFLVVGLCIFITSGTPVIYWSERVGKNNSIFNMPKFRTMTLDAPERPTNDLENPQKFVTPIGKMLRKTSLDETPQIISIIQGHMSFVGPRPALQSQTKLNDLRTKIGVCSLKPGITGWAQINGRDDLNDSEKCELDEYYYRNQSLIFDIKILFSTFFYVFKSKGVKF